MTLISKELYLTIHGFHCNASQLEKIATLGVNCPFQSCFAALSSLFFLFSVIIGVHIGSFTIRHFWLATCPALCSNIFYLCN